MPGPAVGQALSIGYPGPGALRARLPQLGGPSDVLSQRTAVRETFENVRRIGLLGAHRHPGKNGSTGLLATRRFPSYMSRPPRGNFDLPSGLLPG